MVTVHNSNDNNDNDNRTNANCIRSNHSNNQIVIMKKQ